MAVLVGAFVLLQQDPVSDHNLPSVIPTMRPTPVPTFAQPSLPPLGEREPTPLPERESPPVAGDCTVTIPSSVTKVNGKGRYSALQPGDVICLPAGERGNIKFSNLHGSAGRPIVIRNDGGVVHISGMTNRLGGIGLLRSSSVRVTGTGVSGRCGAEYTPEEQECGIVISDALNGIRVLPDGSPRRIELDHLRIERTSTSNHSTGFSIHPDPGQTISGFFVHHNYLVDIFREGMYIGSEPHDDPFESLGKLTDVEISYNLVQRTGYDGIKVKVGVANVSIHDNVVLSPALAQFAKHETGIQIATSSANVYNNVVEGGVEGIGSGRPMPNAVTRYFNNLVTGSATTGFVTAEDGALIYGNTIVGVGTQGILAKGNGTQVFDNIVADSLGLSFPGRSSVSINNLVGVSASMGFVSPASGNYQLRPTSPAVDRGAGTGVYPPIDLLRIERPQGARPDVGAYEYVAP